MTVTPINLVRTITLLGALALAGCDDGSNATQRDPQAAAQTVVAAPEALPPIVEGPLRIEPGAFDFGAIPPESAHEAHFTLANAGTTPITILRVTPTCHCTAPENIVNRVIPPGRSLPFNAAFHAPTETGQKSAKIVLAFAAGGQRYTTQLQLRAVITMAVQSEPTYVDALKGVTDGTVQLTAIDGRPFRVISSNGVAPVFAGGFDPASDPPRSAYDLAWHVPARGANNCPGARLWWIVETDHPDCPILPLRIRHECTGAGSDPDRLQRGWMFGEPLVSLGAVTAGVPFELDVEVFNRGRVTITGVESLTPEATVELLSSRPGEGVDTICRVRFTAAPSTRGMLYAMVLFKSAKGDKDVAFVAKVVPQS